MLVLSRKTNESIIIDGVIEIKVIKIDGEVAKLGIIAPASVPIHRQEVYQEILNSNQQAVIKGPPRKGQIPKLPAQTREKEKAGSSV